MALKEGHKVRALVRNPEKIVIENQNLELVKGSITNFVNINELVKGVDFVISMLGNAELQKTENVNTTFVKKLIPAMRQQGIKRFLYQAGGFSRPFPQHRKALFVRHLKTQKAPETRGFGCFFCQFYRY